MAEASELDPFGLRPIWDALLDLYQRFAEFCERQELRHYAAFGTALGTVRHGGFIPWDDDFDVYMPRGDFERFFELMKDGGNPCLRAANVWTDPNWTLHFGKVFNRDDRVLPKGLSPDWIFIDIFPLDGLPSNLLRFKMWILERAVRRRLAMFVPGKMRRRKLSLALEQWGKKWPYEESHFVQCYQENLCKIKDRLYTREMFGTPQWMKFDRIKIAMPEDADGYLRVEFGDYMQLPPVERRVPTHGGAVYSKGTGDRGQESVFIWK